jgi:1-acyl-sn-glycerol-3-phosphate acyltransferase
MMLYKFARFIFKVYLLIFNRITIKGYENIPQSGGLIICSNHIHWLDPILIAVYIKRKISYMAKAELFKNKFFAIILKGINVFPVKRGTADIAAIKNSLKLIKNGNVLGIFPEGTRSKDGNLKPAEPGVALIAIKTQAPVIPIRISGSYKIFDSINLTFGKPISFIEYGETKLSGEQINELSQLIMKEIGKLA